MLGHIRSGTLDRFKEAFENALNEGKGFAMATRDCTKYFMSQFDEASADFLAYAWILTLWRFPRYYLKTETESATKAEKTENQPPPSTFS